MKLILDNNKKIDFNFDKTITIGLSKIQELGQKNIQSFFFSLEKENSHEDHYVDITLIEINSLSPDDKILCSYIENEKDKEKKYSFRIQKAGSNVAEGIFLHADLIYEDDFSNLESIIFTLDDGNSVEFVNF